MTKQQAKAVRAQKSAPQPKADSALSEAALETVSGGTASSALKKQSDTMTSVISKV